MTRTLRLFGVGFDSASAEISLKIDGTVAYQGAVTTDTERPFTTAWTRPTAQTYHPLDYMVHAWEEDINFAGTRKIEITATKGSFLYLRARSNYMPVSKIASPDSVFSSGKYGNISCFYRQDADGIFRDPVTDVKVDGTSKPRSPVPTESLKWASWYWGIAQGSVLEFDLNISAGLATPIYTDGDTVLATVSYTADGTNTEYQLPTYSGTEFNFPMVYVDNSEWGGPRPADRGQLLPGNILKLNSVPPAGSTVRIDTVEGWDPSLAKYAGFTYQ